MLFIGVGGFDLFICRPVEQIARAFFLISVPGWGVFVQLLMVPSGASLQLTISRCTHGSVCPSAHLTHHARSLPVASPSFLFSRPLTWTGGLGDGVTLRWKFGSSSIHPDPHMENDSRRRMQREDMIGIISMPRACPFPPAVFLDEPKPRATLKESTGKTFIKLLNSD